MASYELSSFSYIENLSATEIATFPDSLLITNSSSSESVLFRLILGSLCFKSEDSEETIDQKIFYGKVTDEFREHNFDNPITQWMNGDFGLLDLDWYFKKNKFNKGLFDNLLIEFTLFFYQKYKNNHTSAFLHLYRALEYMSYSFPITYHNRNNKVYASFDTFKNFFIDKEKGQLKFFREFVKVVFEESLLEHNVRLDTYVNSDLYDKNKLSIIQKLCADFDYTDDGAVVSIKYENLLDFMINLRNRYFHFQYDRRDNISNINFRGESFFEALNDKFVNWLSMIYLEILTQGVYKFNLMVDT